MPRLIRISLIVIAVVGLLGTLAWPSLQRAMMREPVVTAVSAIRTGNDARLRACFTADAVVEVRDPGAFTIPVSLPISTVIDRLRSYLQRDHSGDGTVRVHPLTQVTRLTRDRYSAEVSITIFVEGNDDLPYDTVPITQSAIVDIQRTGLLSYRIARIQVRPDLLPWLMQSYDTVADRGRIKVDD